MEEERFIVPGKDLSNEDVARCIYESHMWLKDPVNNLVGQLCGEIFIKKDTIMCLESSIDLSTADFSNGMPEPRELTFEERSTVRNNRRDIELMQKSIDMITQLNDEVKALKERLNEK